jgi:hypothetical protein
MKIKLAVLLIILGCASGGSRPLLAHHSSSSYDVEHPVAMKGVVGSVEWTNPHVFIHLNVKSESGSVEDWRIEGNSPNMLLRAGWNREMMKPGDSIEVYGALAKDGAKIMRLLKLTLANGQKFDGQGFSQKFDGPGDK